MMDNPVPEQLRLFFQSLVFGAAAGGFYILLGGMRKRRKKFRNAAIDALFWAVCAPAAFCFFMRVNGGDVRGYMLAAMLLGGAAVCAVRYFVFCRNADGSAKSKMPHRRSKSSAGEAGLLK